MDMDVTITQAAIEKLAAKLDELGEVLTSSERNLLLAVFQLASKTLTDAVESAGYETESGGPSKVDLSTLAPRNIPTLSSGFKNAFKPAISKGFTDVSLRKSGVEVGGSVKWSK
jgi:hypothetical protein